MLRSLTAFNTWVDSQSLADREEIKAEGATLSRAAVREAVDHANKHFTAVLLDHPTDAEITARVAMLRRHLASVRLSDG